MSLKVVVVERAALEEDARLTYVDLHDGFVRVSGERSVVNAVFGGDAVEVTPTIKESVEYAEMVARVKTAQMEFKRTNQEIVRYACLLRDTIKRRWEGAEAFPELLMLPAIDDGLDRGLADLDDAIKYWLNVTRDQRSGLE